MEFGTSAGIRVKLKDGLDTRIRFAPGRGLPRDAFSRVMGNDSP
jgi:hypothetical protein